MPDNAAVAHKASVTLEPYPYYPFITKTVQQIDFNEDIVSLQITTLGASSKTSRAIHLASPVHQH